VSVSSYQCSVISGACCVIVPNYKQKDLTTSLSQLKDAFFIFCY
jgi:hypothetical protein